MIGLGAAHTAPATSGPRRRLTHHLLRRRHHHRFRPPARPIDDLQTGENRTRARGGGTAGGGTGPHAAPVGCGTSALPAASTSKCPHLPRGVARNLPATTYAPGPSANPHHDAPC